MKRVLSQDGSYTLFHPGYAQTYHSIHGAFAESTSVYLQNSGVADRLRQGLETRVLEIGFGLGLNFMVSAHRAIDCNASLIYTAYENNPISSERFDALDYGSLVGEEKLQREVSALLKLRQTQSPAPAFLSINNRVTFYLNLADASQCTWAKADQNAIYLDAFSPDSNPELWTTDFLSRLHGALVSRGRLTSYCVKGDIQRRLRRIGFEVNKMPGPGGKREVLVAIKL